MQYDAADKKTDQEDPASYTLEGTNLENVEDILLQKYTFSLQSSGQFCIGGQFENEVVNLTNGDYNGNLYLRKNGISDSLNL